MRKRVMLCIFVFSLTDQAAANPDNPPNGRTGAPGESNCTVGCHNSFALNSGPGVFSISGPQKFQPGQTYELTVSINQIGQER